MEPEQLIQFYNQYFYYFIAGQLLLGLLLGSIPLYLGKRKNKKKLGMIGFFSSGAAGMLSPLLGLIVASAFLVIILLKSKGTPSTADENSSTDVPE